MQEKVEYQMREACQMIKAVVDEQLQELQINIKELNERIMSQIEPMVESTRIDLHNLSVMKTFYFQESIVLTNNDQVCFLTREIPNFSFATKVTLIYRATRDGWYFKDFHNKCDKKGPTITLIKTKGGTICGGYTKKSWLSPPAGDYQNDSFAFVFNVDQQLRYSPQNNSKAIWVSHNSGPNFGGGALELRWEPMNKELAGTSLVDG